MQKIGEICIKTNYNKSCQAKLAIQGTAEISVGFADGHQFGTYQVWIIRLKKLLYQRHDFSKKVISWVEEDGKVIVIPINCEVPDEENVEMVLKNNNSKSYYNVVCFYS